MPYSPPELSEEFLIPREAYRAVAAQRDALLEVCREAAEFQFSSIVVLDGYKEALSQFIALKHKLRAVIAATENTNE